MADLAEAKYSAQQMQDMMKKGHAMPNEKDDPSYPIEDKEDLGNAIKAVGRGGADSSKIKAHIMKRAKALDAEDMIPKDWGSGSSDGKPAKGKNPFAQGGKLKESISPDILAPPEQVLLPEDKVITEATGQTTMTVDLTGTSVTLPPAEITEADPHKIGEMVELGEAVRTEDLLGRRRKIQLIKAGWSKNGRYYPKETLAEAARNGVFPAGTPMYANHPTATEKIERPERGIQDLVARLDTPARLEGDALIAEATHFGYWLPIFNGPNGLADHVEVSVRCLGEVDYGTAEGQEGLIVRKITEGMSVDFVTEGAAGGKVLELLESARLNLEEGRNVGVWLEAQLHSAFTQMCDEMYGGGRLSREERISLSNGLGDALQAFVRRIEHDQPQLYKRDLYGSPDQVSEMAETEETTESEAPEITESNTPEGTEMTESQGGTPSPTPGTTRALVAQELAEVRRERDLAIARERARELIPQALVDAWIPPSTQIRITESVMTALPIKEGRLDEVELAKTISRHVEIAEREMAEALEAAGVGSPRDLGQTSQAGNFGFGIDRAELDGRLTKAFTSLGLSESATKRAVQGRD